MSYYNPEDEVPYEFLSEDQQRQIDAELDQFVAEQPWALESDREQARRTEHLRDPELRAAFPAVDKPILDGSATTEEM